MHNDEKIMDLVDGVIEVSMSLQATMLKMNRLLSTVTEILNSKAENSDQKQAAASAKLKLVEKPSLN
jgi:hypothetical protein